MKSEAQIRETRDGLLIRANQMRQMADSMGEFETVDCARLQREIDERERWIDEATSRNHDYDALAEALSAAKAAKHEAQRNAEPMCQASAVIQDRHGTQEERLGTHNPAPPGP